MYNNKFVFYLEISSNIITWYYLTMQAELLLIINNNI